MDPMYRERRVHASPDTVPSTPSVIADNDKLKKLGRFALDNRSDGGVRFNLSQPGPVVKAEGAHEGTVCTDRTPDF